MTRAFLIIAVLTVVLASCTHHRSQLQIYIASKEARDGLHEANFPKFPKLGYIAKQPDLTISQLEGVSFGPPPIIPGRSSAPGKPIEDRDTLVLHLTGKDADALNTLTAAHLGDRLLLLLNDQPLFAPEIRTPSVGQSVYMTPPRGMETPKLKAKLETLVQKTK